MNLKRLKSLYLIHYILETMTEIERKFLPSTSFDLTKIKQLAQKSFQITQGYLSSVPERTVRVRTKDEKGFLTIKGIGKYGSTTRFEWEKEILVDEAFLLLDLCEAGKIAKTRYEVLFVGNVFEIDVFQEDNSGLIVIEIELESENQFFEKPDWLGQEVTGDHRYFNSYLSQKPFGNW